MPDRVFAFRYLQVSDRQRDGRCLRSISETQRKKLASAKLIELPEAVLPITLGQFIESYFATVDSKRSTKTFYSHTRKRLVEFFAPATPISSITPTQARECPALRV